jgi:lactoylglutathione lyase
MNEVVVESAFPILSTVDLRRALHFWCDVLGGVVAFQFPPEGDPDYVGIDLGSSHLGIGRDTTIEPGGAQRISLWIYVQDCDEAVAKVREAGGRVVEEPVDEPWGERVARVEDFDGNRVIIGARLTAA